MHEFKVSNYASESTVDSAWWWRGYAFTVNNPVKIYKLLAGVRSTGANIGLYESGGTYGHVPQTLLFGSKINTTGRGIEINIPKALELDVGQHYVLAQGFLTSTRAAAHTVDDWDQAAMVAAEPWINYWFPIGTDFDPEACLLWAGGGDLSYIIGKAAEHDSGRVPGRPDIGMVGLFEGKLFEMWAKVGGAWKDVVDVSGKVGTWKEATDFIPKVGGTWKE